MAPAAFVMHLRNQSDRAFAAPTWIGVGLCDAFHSPFTVAGSSLSPEQNS
jgi:hypothetical protein